MTSNVDNTNIALAITPIWRLAFRPLFLGGTIFSVIAMAWWSHFWSKPLNWQPHGNPIWWHGHEMLFGFGAAIIVGFLLTAVATWTGVTGLRGKPLAVLALTWLFGRLLLAFGAGLTPWLIAAVDVAFPLLASIAMAYPVAKVKQWRNIMFVPILLVMALLNASSHWAVITGHTQLAMQSLHATIMLFTLIIMILGGRVIPAFTTNATGCQKHQAIKWLEITSIISVILLLLIALVGFTSVLSILLFIISCIAALANGWRFSRWGIQHTWSAPLLWSLHLAYIFIPIGFVLLAMHSISLMVNNSVVMHSFAVGAIGGIILAMVSRVTLGHTGRPLNQPKLTTVAYIFILSASAIRIVFPAWLPELTNWGIGVAGSLWVLAYAIYIYFYGPMLVTARADGRPG